MNKGKQRPYLVDARPKGVLFSTKGPTGWGRRRDLGNYKEGKSEKDFSHLHAKFTEEEG
jgi:hypothetical protein